MKKLFAITFALTLGILLMPLACSSPARYADGIWEGKTSTTIEGYRGEARIKVEGGKIVKADCLVLDGAAGKAVDASYAEYLGEGIGVDLSGLKAYSEKLVSTQDLAQVTELKEAPWTYTFFVDAMMSALGKAKRALVPPSLADGTFEVVESTADGEDYLTKGRLVVEGGKIARAEVVIWDQARDRPFDGSYEEVYVGQDEYVQQCRNDWAGLQKYQADLVALQQLDSVDVVSGATWSFKKFKMSMDMALEKAKK